MGRQKMNITKNALQEHNVISVFTVVISEKNQL